MFCTYARRAADDRTKWAQKNATHNSPADHGLVNLPDLRLVNLRRSRHLIITQGGLGFSEHDLLDLDPLRHEADPHRHAFFDRRDPVNHKEFIGLRCLFPF